MRRGFPLTEVIVATVAIGMLVAIAVPAYHKAHEKTRSSSCLSNVRQISAGIRSYAQDYDDYLPQVEWQPRAGRQRPAPIRWTDAIAPYLKNTQVLLCLDAKHSPDILHGNYGMVAQAVGYHGIRPGFINAAFSCVAGKAPRRLQAVRSPDKRIMMGDAAEYRVDVRYWNATSNPDRKSPGGAYYWMEGRARGGANCGFMDGHAKWLKLTSPCGPQWPNVCAGPIEYYSTE